ncbi:signal transduction histidine kinase [Nocardioides panaciterrulae]|uniref:Signal transduction histidine kinase n=1 Tax=Nocardioides panaciterrulae TaxID=661492 RepID=A0A7Y9E707_9ACTN|nr:signal transduction histidine kinase [Nocardioides panaciterrulae]
MLRAVVLANALVLDVRRLDDAAHPRGLAGCLLLLVAWTALATWGYAVPGRRTPTLLVADLLVAAGLLLVSPVVLGGELDATVPGFWVMAPLLAWAIHWRWSGGLVAGVVLSACDLAVRDHFTQANYGNVFLLLVGGPVVGLMSASVQQMAEQRDVAERNAAAAAERARLARAVHDGVLQVLALVQRRGAELGGEGAELGRLAGEQEAALRALIRRQDSLGTSPAAGPGADPVAGPVDLAEDLARLESTRRVTVAVPGSPVPVPVRVARELVAVVEACLDNVARHVGPAAPAWVLIEALPGEVTVSVRDEGPGIPAGRLDRAEREGRLGVTESIRGRVADLGGTATLSTGPWGTEWELVVPVEG